MYNKVLNILSIIGLIVLSVGGMVSFIGFFVFGGVLPTLFNPEVADILFAIGVPSMIGGFAMLIFACGLYHY